MDPPRPPAYLVREQVDAICHSAALDGQDTLQRLLRYIVEQTLAGERTTEAIVEHALWKQAALDKTTVRANLTRLRKRIAKYYASIESQTAIVLVSIPQAGLDSATREFRHYRAEFSFHPEMLHSATAFSQALHYKYGVQPADGEQWFNTGLEPVSLLRTVIQRHRTHALLLSLLYLNKTDEKRQAIFTKILRLYELSEATLDSAASAGVEHQNFQVSLAIGLVTTTIRAVDILVSNFAEVTANRCAITEELRHKCETALSSIFSAARRFKELLDQKLLPLTGMKCKLYGLDYGSGDERAYYMLLVDIRNVEAFNAAMAGSEHLDLGEYGTVVAKGWGARPAGLEATLLEAYGLILVADDVQLPPPRPLPSAKRPSA